MAQASQLSRTLATVHSQEWLRKYLTAKDHYTLCGAARSLLPPFEKEFDGLARDSRAIVDHKLEVAQRESANRSGGNSDGRTSEWVGIVDSEESGCSS